MARDFTLNQYRIFLRAAELGSITRTAHALALPQPSVSRSIARMESGLQVKLIERHRNGIRLTAAGERFNLHAREAVRQFDLARVAASRAGSQLTGEVRLAAPESVGGMLFVPLVKAFQQHFPDARIRVMTGASAHIPTLMDNQVVDLGIVADTHAAPTADAEILGRESLYLVAPAGRRIGKQKTITLGQLEQLPLYLNAMQGGFRARIDEACARANVTLQVLAEIDANESLLDLVLDERGYTILPYSAIARPHRVKQFTAARIVEPDISRQLKLVTASNRPLPPIARETPRLLRRIFQQQAKMAGWQVAPSVAARE